MGSPTAANVLFGLIACINTDDPDFQPLYKVKYADFFPGHTDKVTYSRAVEVCQSLTSTRVDIETYDETKKNNKSGGRKYRGLPFFTEIIYDDGYVYASFNPKLRPHLLNLRKNFTMVEFQAMAKMESLYSKGMLQVIQSWAGLSEYTIPLVDLQDWLDVPDGYRRDFTRFRTRVLEQAKKELKRHAGIIFDFQPKKTGKKVTHIRFILTRKKAVETSSEAQKAKEARRKAINNARFQKALACSTKKDGDCTEKDNKPVICKICADFNFCESIKKTLKNDS
jgi:plasmid replication initiation protein